MPTIVISNSLLTKDLATAQAQLRSKISGLVVVNPVTAFCIGVGEFGYNAIATVSQEFIDNGGSYYQDWRESPASEWVIWGEHYEITAGIPELIASDIADEILNSTVGNSQDHEFDEGTLGYNIELLSKTPEDPPSVIVIEEPSDPSLRAVVFQIRKFSSGQSGSLQNRIVSADIVGDYHINGNFFIDGQYIDDGLTDEDGDFIFYLAMGYKYRFFIDGRKDPVKVGTIPTEEQQEETVYVAAL